MPSDHAAPSTHAEPSDLAKLAKADERPVLRTPPEQEEVLVDGNQLKLLHDGVQCFPAMLEAIRRAQREVLLEMYWFTSDQIGWTFARELMDRARDGLVIRVVYDAVGSIDASSTIFDAMRAAGVQVAQYNPIAPWRKRFRLENTTRRNHRKMLVVDGAIGFTGGLNIGDPWLPQVDGGGGWRDDMVRIEGPAAQAMRDIFMHGWELMKQDAGAWEKLPPTLFPEPSAKVRVLANHYFGKKRAIRNTYLQQIHEAQDTVYITNSYFVPDRTI